MEVTGGRNTGRPGQRLMSTARWFAASRAQGCTGTSYDTVDDTISHAGARVCPLHEHGLARIIRVNGTPVRIPAAEFPDPAPNRAGEQCGEIEIEGPNGEGGVAVCTLPPHDDSPGLGTWHIAHDGEGQVLAIWGPPAEVRPEETG